MDLSDGYIAYIINPKSGASSSKRLVSEFKDYLLSRDAQVRVLFTESLEHAREIANNAAQDDNCSMVVACGGDGTIREVMHGLEGSQKPMIIVPCGTENLLANELGYDDRTKTLISAFEGDCIKTLDLGIVNDYRFTSIAGIGFDGEVVKRVNEKRGGHINHLDYFWPLWRTFWSHKFPNFKVSVDGEDIFEGEGMVFVGNISRYAVGLQILHYADFGDGLLDICIYKCNSRPRLLKHSFLTILKHHAKRSDVIYRQGKSIHISSTLRTVATEIDGDPGPSLPLKIEVIPQAVRVLVSPDAKPAGIRTRLKRIIG
jgi:diacylglycerol kinase (ATP)